MARYIYWLREDGVNLDVADGDEDERQEEDQSVDDSVVDGVPALRVNPTKNIFRLVCFRIEIFFSQIFKEIYRRTLVEILGEELIEFVSNMIWKESCPCLSGVFQHSKYDGLRWGTDQSEDPGTQNHQPSFIPI